MAILRQIQDAKILIVDDQASEVWPLEQRLKDFGCMNVHSTADPDQILRLDALHHFDLVLLNLRLTRYAMEQLKTLNQERYLPVLGLVSRPDGKARGSPLPTWIRGVVSTFSKQELLDRMRNALEVLSVAGEERLVAEGVEQSALPDTAGSPHPWSEIIRRLEWAATYRDNQTGLHNVRTSRFCALIGRAAGMDEQQSDVLLNASLMHDIGKIGIPDRILLKPGALDPAEWEIMKTHTVIGAEILSDPQSDTMQMARVIALTHHEKWDGSGYPAGLQGEAIPFAGRVVALCDVFDSLTSGHRPYKPSWTIENTMAYIVQNSARQFDPALVKVLQNVLPEMIELEGRYADPLQ
jgi:putative two-component system response regulator